MKYSSFFKVDTNIDKIHQYLAASAFIFSVSSLSYIVLKNQRKIVIFDTLEICRSLRSIKLIFFQKCSFIWTFDIALFFHFLEHYQLSRVVGWGEKIFISIFKSPTFQEIKKSFFQKKSSNKLSIFRRELESTLLYFHHECFLNNDGSNLLSSTEWPIWIGTILDRY